MCVKVKNKKIEVGVIGCGYRGKYLLKLLSAIDMYDIVAAADIVDVELEGMEHLQFYSGDNCLDELLSRHKLDLLVVASIWDTHSNYAITALQAGCNVALEVKGALFEGEYEAILDQANQSGKRVYFLENTVFDKAVMSVVNMCKEGVFGDVVWAKGSYRHDLRDLFFAKGDNHWRAKYYKEIGGDLYPTHSVAPVSLAMGVNRGVGIRSIGSFSTAAKGVQLYNEEHTDCVVGDVVTTLITTDSGGVITLTHDTTLPRPKSLEYEIQGTRGVWRYEGRVLCIEGVTEVEKWVSDADLVEEYRSDLWLRYEGDAMVHDAHHSGMDYVMLCSMGEDMNGERDYEISDSDILFWTNISLWSRDSIVDNRRIYLDSE